MKASDFYNSSYSILPDTQFYIEIAKKYSLGSILEIGCGTGRILLEIAKQNYAIDGLDCNAERLNICKQNLLKLPSEIQEKVTLVEELSDNYHPKKTYSLIILPFRVLQEMGSIEQQEASLKHLKTLLTPTGRIVFDILYPSPKLLVNLETNLNQKTNPKSFTNDDGTTFTMSLRTTQINTLQQTFLAEKIYEFEEDGILKENSYQWSSRYLNRYEAMYLLKYLGLKIEAVYGDFDQSPLENHPCPKNMIFIAQNQ